MDRLLIVAPLVGAWIEIPDTDKLICNFFVAPLVGAWIEIFDGTHHGAAASSLLSWERGLKYIPF